MTSLALTRLPAEVQKAVIAQATKLSSVRIEALEAEVATLKAKLAQLREEGSGTT